MPRPILPSTSRPNLNFNNGNDLVPADTVHEYSLKSRWREYAVLTIKSHARTVHDPPLLYLGEEIKGFVILSLTNLSGMQGIDVVVSRVFNWGECH